MILDETQEHKKIANLKIFPSKCAYLQYQAYVLIGPGLRMG